VNQDTSLSIYLLLLHVTRKYRISLKKRQSKYPSFPLFPDCGPRRSNRRCSQDGRRRVVGVPDDRTAWLRMLCWRGGGHGGGLIDYLSAGWEVTLHPTQSSFQTILSNSPSSIPEKQLLTHSNHELPTAVLTD
jgi:hypothetical protein